jgi:MIP family channel proteins
MTVTSTRSVASTSRRPPDVRTGHHGHIVDGALSNALIAEAVGTLLFALTFEAALVAMRLADPVAGPIYSSLSVPVASGTALVAVIALAGPISGAHLNPAVSLAAAFDGELRWRRLPAYVCSQLAGAVGASLIVWWWFGDAARSRASLGAPRPAASVSDWTAFAAVAVATFALIAVVLVVASGRRLALVPTAPLVIGAALGAAILLSGPVSGGSVNPASALGSMIVSSDFDGWWIYVFAPLVGGCVAVVSVRASERAHVRALEVATDAAVGEEPS